MEIFRKIGYRRDWGSTRNRNDFSMNANEKKGQIFYLSVLTVLSSLAVVILHCNGVFWHKPTGYVWTTACLIESLFYFAVPVFFMISGCTLIDYGKRYSTAQFFRKRASRTLVPFLIWSGIAAVFMWSLYPEKEWSVGYVISGILNHRFMDIYWFFLPLFAIYLSMPVLTDIQNKVRTFTYMAMFGVVTISLFGFLRACGVTDIPYSLTAPVCGGFLVYPLLGYVLHHTMLPRLGRWLIYAGGMGATAAHFGFTYGCTPEGGDIFGLFSDYLHISTVLQACAVFVFVKHNAHVINARDLLRKAVLYIQPAALGIYLSHQYLIFFMNEIGVNEGSLLYRTVGAVCMYLVLALLIRQLQRVRWLRVLFP